MDFAEQQVLEREAFEAVRASMPLAGKKIINTGSFSVLFEGATPASVYRLSSDNATHDFAARAKKLGVPGVVRLLDDFGAVALYQDDYLWLAHLEHLECLDAYPIQQEAVARLLLHLTDDDDGDLLTTQEDRLAVVAKLDDAPIEPCTRLAIEAIQCMLPDYISESNVDLDLQASNFMVRAATGDVVLSDPVSGLSNISEERHERLLAEGIVVEVQD